MCFMVWEINALQKVVLLEYFLTVTISLYHLVIFPSLTHPYTTYLVKFYIAKFIHKFASTLFIDHHLSFEVNYYRRLGFIVLSKWCAVGHELFFLMEWDNTKPSVKLKIRPWLYKINWWWWHQHFREDCWLSFISMLLGAAEICKLWQFP